jgi:RNA polymerase sigma-70 factor (ECF subfamily)
MEDIQIIDLYFARDERAIEETRISYGRLLVSISMRILHSMEDAMECENDTYLRTWNAIPPQRPLAFAAFLSRIVRNLSLDRYDMMHADKRGNAEIPALLDELAEVIPDREVERAAEAEEIRSLINAFLGEQKPEARKMFVRRYFMGASVREIALKYDSTESRVKMTLMRMRQKLKEYLEKEGIAL